MMQYSIIANSHWLLVEGIYLHNLLAVTVLTEGNHFSIYLCIGWGKVSFKHEQILEIFLHTEYICIVYGPCLKYFSL